MHFFVTALDNIYLFKTVEKRVLPLNQGILTPLPSPLYRCLEDFSFFKILMVLFSSGWFAPHLLPLSKKFIDQFFTWEICFSSTNGTLLGHWTRQKSWCTRVGAPLMVFRLPYLVTSEYLRIVQVQRMTGVLCQCHPFSNLAHLDVAVPHLFQFHLEHSSRCPMSVTIMFTDFLPMFCPFFLSWKDNWVPFKRRCEKWALLGRSWWCARTSLSSRRYIATSKLRWAL